MTLDCRNNFVSHIVDKISLPEELIIKKAMWGFFENPGGRVFINWIF